jgi:putative DNA methylase
MFSHHILKPERMPIEANIWGTPKSSGSFSTLFRTRLIRAIDYREAPFEITIEYSAKKKKGLKVFGISAPIGGLIFNSCRQQLKPGAIYLSCGSSTKVDITDNSIDLIVTDPPFFDNVHYSELADFFYVWQELYFGNNIPAENITTRREDEVQDVDADKFSEKLRRVFLECHRVLRDDGLLIFSYHHSREEGWSAVAKAVLGADFSFVQSQPVKSEMSVAAPKSQTKEPIDLDILLVCRKRTRDFRSRRTFEVSFGLAKKEASRKISRFNLIGRHLSKNDIRIILLSQLLVELSAGNNLGDVMKGIEKLFPITREIINKCWNEQIVKFPDRITLPGNKGFIQFNLFD